jgi:clan AA aspartic protease
MGHVHASIELINFTDLEMARRSQIDKDEVRRIRVEAMVDSGAFHMVINENIQQILQIPVIGKKWALLADGKRVECDHVFPIEIRFENRTANCDALVLPGDDVEPLLGMLPLEHMDVLIDPVRQRLIVNPAHPDYAVLKLRTLFRKREFGNL